MQVSRVVAKGQVPLERARARYGWFDVALSTFKTYSLTDGGTYSAALTYYFFFSIFPLLLFAASILGYLTLGNEALRQDILDAGVRSVPLLRSVMSQETLATVEHQRNTLAVTGVALALYSGTGAIVALGHSLNHIQGVTTEGNFLIKRVRALRWLLVLGAAALVSVAAGAFSGWAANIFDGPVATATSWLLGHIVGVVVGIGMFATAFRFLPARASGWKEVLPGAVSAAVAFEILKEVGAWYLDRGAQGRSETFGALAAAAGLLVASYLIAQTLLLSATLNTVLAERRTTRGITEGVGTEG